MNGVNDEKCVYVFMDFWGNGNGNESFFLFLLFVVVFFF